MTESTDMRCLMFLGYIEGEVTECGIGFLRSRVWGVSKKFFSLILIDEILINCIDG